MPSYLIEAEGHTNFTIVVEADSPEEALAKAEAMEPHEWQVERDAEPTRGNITHVTDMSGEHVEYEVDANGVVQRPIGLKELLEQPRDEFDKPDPLHAARKATLEGTQELADAGALNKEGLTFTEWLAAAGIWHDDGELQPLPIGSSYEAWKAGEDPTEWRAESSNGEKL